MTPHDIIEIWRECPHLSQSQLDRFLAADISIEALSADPDEYWFAVAADSMVFDRRQLNFKWHVHHPGECPVESNAPIGVLAQQGRRV